MLGEAIDRTLKQVPALSENGLKLSRALHKAVLQGGDGARRAADILHGVWLGHPLHPMLTDVSIGAWSLSSFFDILSLFDDSQKSQNTADSLVELGNLAALPTVLAGLADFSTIPKGAAGVGLGHATLNASAYTLYLASGRARSAGNRSQAVALSTFATSLMLASAYLGGHLSFSKRVGVNHAKPPAGPQDWTPVLASTDLQEANPARVKVEGSPVLLYRKGDRVMAIGAVCAHAGGPLEKGDFHDDSVQCPWHDSVFSLQDGRVVHGPSTYHVPHYHARLNDGSVEIRLARA